MSEKVQSFDKELSKTQITGSENEPISKKNEDK